MASLFGLLGLSFGVSTRGQVFISFSRGIARGSGFNATAGVELSGGLIADGGKLPLFSNSLSRITGVDVGSVSFGVSDQPSVSVPADKVFRGRASFGAAFDVYRGTGQSITFATPALFGRIRVCPAS